MGLSTESWKRIMASVPTRKMTHSSRRPQPINKQHKLSVCDLTLGGNIATLNL